MPISQASKGNLAQRVKETIILTLQYYFQNVSDFGFPDNPIKEPIISEAFPLELRQYPAIMIKILNESRMKMSIGQDFIEDVLSDDQQPNQQWLPGTEVFKRPVPYRRRVVAERFGLMTRVTFNLQVWGDTTPVRNAVSDQVFDAFEIFMREPLLSRGIELEDISAGEETDYPLDDIRKIYIQNINLTVNAEMYFDKPVGYVTAVNTREYHNLLVHPDQPSYILEEYDDVIENR